MNLSRACALRLPQVCFPKSIRRRGALLAAVWFTGCATGHLGTVAGRYSLSKDALVLDTYAFGIEVRPRAETRGGMFGYGHTVYVFDRRAVPELPPTGRWQCFRITMPKVAPLFVATSRVGLDLGANRDLAGLSLGYSSMAAARLSVRDSQRLELHYDPRHPDQTVARLIHYDQPKPKTSRP